MTQSRRELILRVADGEESALMPLYHFHQLRRCDEVLGWLVRHGITGRRFSSWIREEHGSSILKAAAQVIMRIEHAPSIRPIEADRDYILNLTRRDHGTQ